jgi:hypothetical protein
MRSNETIAAALAACLSALAASCVKDAPAPLDTAPQPVVNSVIKPRGQIIGEAVSAVIGPEGGVLSYGEALMVNVPAGAVDKPTTFEIQPISNTLQEKEEPNAFRLFPEGVHFSKPVTLSFIYAENTESNPAARMVAFQQSDGRWCGVPTALAERQRRLTVQTSHFSDWVWFDIISLQKDSEKVRAGETVNLKLMEQVLGELVPAHHIDSVPLGAMDEIGFWQDDITIANWKIISGPGTLVPEPNKYGKPGNATYTAPPVINEVTEVEIQVEVTSKNGQISDPAAPNGRRKLGKLILLTKIRLEPDTYFFLEIDGVRHDLSAEAGGSNLNGEILVSGANDQHIMTLRCFGGQPAAYPGGIDPGETLVMLSIPMSGTSARPFQNVYTQCPDQHFSGATEIVNTGRFIQGAFSGTVYYSNQSCGYADSRNVTCTFKVKNDTYNL